MQIVVVVTKLKAFNKGVKLIIKGNFSKDKLIIEIKVSWLKSVQVILNKKMHDIKMPAQNLLKNTIQYNV